MKPIRTTVLILACAFSWEFTVTAQQQAAPTNNVLTRLSMVESSYGRGTIFSIDVDHREYWITAKHILNGAKHPPYGSVSAHSVSLRILDPGAQGEKWLQVSFGVVDPGVGIDIVVLVPAKPLLSNPLPSVAAASEGAMLGGDCEFLGFPYGGGWRATLADGGSLWLPYVKHCTVSAISTVEPKVWVLDGLNNAGFSGGPVVIHTGADQRILAVVSGYILEPTDVIFAENDKPPSSKAKKPIPHQKETVNLNSGFVIAYDIKYAIDAISKNPTGPVREER